MIGGYWRLLQSYRTSNQNEWDEDDGEDDDSGQRFALESHLRDFLADRLNIVEPVLIVKYQCQGQVIGRLKLIARHAVGPEFLEWHRQRWLNA